MWILLLLIPLLLCGCGLDTPKEILKAAANDLYTVLMVSLVIYTLSFMCQPFERGLMRSLILVIFVDGVMRIITYLLGV